MGYSSLKYTSAIISLSAASTAKASPAASTHSAVSASMDAETLVRSPCPRPSACVAAVPSSDKVSNFPPIIPLPSGCILPGCIPSVCPSSGRTPFSCISPSSVGIFSFSWDWPGCVLLTCSSSGCAFSSCTSPLSGTASSSRISPDCA